MKYIITILLSLFCTFNLLAQNMVAEVEFCKTSIEQAKPKLTKKFGKPVIEGDDMLIFKNVTYNGIFFDRVWFCFQSSAKGNILSKCWFVRNLTTASAAKGIREKIFNQVKDKYEFSERINSQGFKEYYIGTSPTNSSEPYFRICANKFSSGQYSASVEYGPFE